MEQLREKLKELRARRGWSHEDLAREIAVNLSTVQRWEKGGVKSFCLTHWERRRLFEEVGIDGEG